MGMVTDVVWECPGCREENIAQLAGDHYFNDDYETPLPRNAIPSHAELKWNPPCENCGKYRLSEPRSILVSFPITRVED